MSKRETKKGERVKEPEKKEYKAEKREGKGEKARQKGEAEKKEENAAEVKPIATWKFVLVCAIIVLVSFSIFIVPKLLKNVTFEKNKYNSFEFAKTKDGFWYTTVQKGSQPFQIPFYYHPRELEDIPVEQGLRNKFFDMRNNGSIYITLDPDYNSTAVIAGVEIAKITGTKYGLLNVPTRSGFIKQPKQSATETETPIITCNNANNQTLVVWITLSDKNIAYSYGYCVILEAKSYDDMIRVADRTMYHLLGIMN
jgi:hypothetical protein